MTKHIGRLIHADIINLNSNYLTIKNKTNMKNTKQVVREITNNLKRLSKSLYFMPVKGSIELQITECDVVTFDSALLQVKQDKLFPLSHNCACVPLFDSHLTVYITLN
jgi:hypothetical protein